MRFDRTVGAHVPIKTTTGVSMFGLRISASTARPAELRHFSLQTVALAALLVSGCAGGASSPSGIEPTSPAPETASSGPGQSPTASASASASLGTVWQSGGLTWTAAPADAPLMHGVFAVPNGLVGVCDPSGEEVGQACTSKDGLTWSIRPDAAIFGADGATPFRARFAVHGPAGWVAADNGFVGFTDSPEYASVWHSSDGIHWQLAPASASLKGLIPGAMFVAKSGFLLYGAAQGKPVLLASADGATWTPAPAGTVVPVCSDGSVSFGSPFSPGKELGPPTQFSANGLDWQALSRPAAVQEFSSVAALPNGTFLATSWDSQSQKSLLFKSTDGRAWSQLDPRPAPVDWVVVFAGKLLGSGPDSAGNGVTWISPDGGSTWQPLLAADGSSMTSGIFVVAGNLLLITSGGAQFTIVAIARAS